jgi:hypothetical protein
LLQLIVHRKQRIGDLDRIALAHRERLQSSDFFGRNENEIGLDPALIDVVVLVAGCEQEHERASSGGGKQTGRHVSLHAENNRSQTTHILVRTSSALNDRTTRSRRQQ